MKRRSNMYPRATVALMIAAGAAPLCRGQDGTGEQVAPEASSAELADVPTDLPGHEEGARRRPKEEAAAPEEAAEEAPEWFGGKEWWDWERATGNWSGLRDRLEKIGLDFNGSYTGEWSNVFSGGVDRDSSYRHLLDFNLTADLGTMAGLTGGSVFADFYSYSGESLWDDAGDFAGSSDIEISDAKDQLAELWYEQWVFEKVARLKFGKIDAYEEFGSWNLAEEFVNSAASASPTMLAFPGYPDPAMGVCAFVYPCEGFYLGGGFFDGATQDGLATGGRGAATFFSDSKSDSWYAIGEAGCTFETLGALRSTRLAVGGWGHTGDFERFDGGIEEGTAGFYALAETMVWKANAEDAEDARGLSLVARYGWADEDVAEAVNHVAAGINLTGTFAGREDDAAGVLVSWVDLNETDGAGFSDDETAIEVFYKLQLTPSVSIKPDVQFILNPSGDASVDDAVVGLLRIEIAF